MESTAKTPRIMVVDDDRDTTTILCTHLEREGFAAIAAFSGAECLALARQRAVDVILLDLMMPGMDGFEVCRALRADKQTEEIPIVILSARDDIASRAEAMALGVADYLTKPVTRRQLANRVRAQLSAIAAGLAADEVRSRIRSADGK